MNIQRITSTVIALLVCVPAAILTAAPPAATAPFTITTTSGQAIAIPGKSATILVFLRPNQPQSTDEIVQLTALLKNRTDLQILGIVSGDDSPAGAAQLSAGGKWPLPLAADPHYSASGNFDVHVWPTLVIESKSGERIAHIAGLPATFTSDVAAYLDYADGKIDQPGLAKRLADRTVIADSADQKAARHVQVAARLAEQGMKDAALEEIAHALENKPTAPETLLAIARIQLTAAQPAAAEKTLASMPAGAIQPAQLQTLQGWAAIEENRWPDAQKFLEKATQLNPDPADAFYLLGVVEQHDGNASAAAAAFRQAFEHTPTGKPIAIGNP